MSGAGPAVTARASPVSRGFSLLELLVTLFVIVLVTSLVTLNVPAGGGDVQLEQKLRNLVDTAEYALDEAQFVGRDFGLLLREIDAGGARVYAWDWRERQAQGWREPASGKDVFAGQKLPPNVELQLELENVAVTELSPRPGEEEQAPQVILYASGETIPGAIDVRSRDNGDLLWRLQWDLLGRFDLLRRGEEEEEER